MKKHDHHVEHELFEYHGNTAIERIRMKNGKARRDWLFFDTIEEAISFFNDYCVCCEAA